MLTLTRAVRSAPTVSLRILQYRQLSASYILAKPSLPRTTLLLSEEKLTSPPRVKPVFNCGKCERVFKSKGALTRHMRQCICTLESSQTDSSKLSTEVLASEKRLLEIEAEDEALHSSHFYGEDYESVHNYTHEKSPPPRESTETSGTSDVQSAPTNRNWFQKMDVLTGSSGVRQEVLEHYFELMVNTDLTVNKESKMDEALEEFLSLKSNPNVKVNLNTITNYNTFLRGFAREGDFKQIQELWQEMTKSSLEPDLSSYISVLLSFHEADHTNPVYQKVFNALYEDFEKAGYTLDVALLHGDFLLEDRKRFLRTVQVFRGLDTSPYVPSEPRSPSPLVEELGRRDSSHLTSQVEDIMDCQQLREGLQKQVETERQLMVPIPSLFRTENSALLKTFLDDLVEGWRRNIGKQLQTKIYGRNSLPIWEVGSSVRYNNFLTFLPPEKLTEIILAKAVTILIRDGFSEPLPFIRAELGESLMKAYHMSIKTEEEPFGDFFQGLTRYHEWYCDPKDKEPTHREALAKAMWNVSIGTKMKKWPKSLRLTLGDELLKILFSSCKIDKLFHAESEHVVLGGRYLTCHNNEWSETTTSEKTNRHPAFFKIYRKRKGNYDVEEVKPNPAVHKLFAASSLVNLTFPPEDLPMLVPPLPWTSAYTGGYIIKDTLMVKYPDIGIYQHDKMILSLPPGGLNPVLDSLNQLGSVAWRVNKPILDLAIQLFTDPNPDQSLLYELDLPIHKDQIRGEPQLSEDIKAVQKAGGRLSETQKLEFRNYHNARQMHAKLKEEKHSLWCSALYRLSLAKHFQDSVLWFPHNVDFRGRCYPIPSQFNHMGADLARSLLVFAKGKKLGPNGFYWLKLHCINLTGTMKKESIDKRLEYVDQIMDKIIDSARDPLNGERWWLESDDPWQTLSACIEIRNALEHPGGAEDYTCHLPIHQDGSCNGLQHYAALGRDRLGAEAVNLVPSHKPGDVYSLIASIVDSKREADSKEGNELAKILEGHIKRKVVKQTVMTTVYGVTRYGAKLQVKKQLKDIRDFPFDSVDEASSYVSSKTFDSLNEVFESSQRIQSWLTECAAVISKDCKSEVSWITPLGFPVVQPYYKKLKIDKKVDLDRKFLEREDRKEDLPSFSVNTSKNRNGFPPNFIHSLDSSHMMLTSLHLWIEGITFASVHDCFWTHACDVETMNRICREQFIALHKYPILENLSEHFQTHHVDSISKEDYIIQNYKPKTVNNVISDKQREREEERFEKYEENYVTNMARRTALFNEIPQKGELDLNVVKDSTYFFS